MPPRCWWRRPCVLRGKRGWTWTLTPAPSWATLRDMLGSGQVVAAQMLSPLPVAGAVGLGGGVARLEALMVLSLNGDVIGVSRDLAARMRAQGFGFDFVAGLLL